MKLTTREIQVMALLSEGHGTVSAAKQLQTTRANVYNYVRSLYKKTGIPRVSTEKMKDFLAAYKAEAYPPGITPKQIARLIRYAAGESYEQIAAAEHTPKKPSTPTASTIEQTFSQICPIIGAVGDGVWRRRAVHQWLLKNGHFTPTPTPEIEEEDVFQ